MEIVQQNEMLEVVMRTDTDEVFEFIMPCTVVRNTRTRELTLLVTTAYHDMIDPPPSNDAAIVLNWLGYQLPE